MKRLLKGVVVQANIFLSGRAIIVHLESTSRRADKRVVLRAVAERFLVQARQTAMLVLQDNINGQGARAPHVNQVATRDQAEAHRATDVHQASILVVRGRVAVQVVVQVSILAVPEIPGVRIVLQVTTRDRAEPHRATHVHQASIKAVRGRVAVHVVVQVSILAVTKIPDAPCAHPGVTPIIMVKLRAIIVQQGQKAMPVSHIASIARWASFDTVRTITTTVSTVELENTSLFTAKIFVCCARSDATRLIKALNSPAPIAL